MISKYHDTFHIVYEVGWRPPIPEVLSRPRRASEVYILGKERSSEALFDMARESEPVGLV